jgi:hypothetical protein
MKNYIIEKTDQSTGRTELYITLLSALRSEGIESLYRVARHQIKKSGKFEFMQYVFQKLTK